MRRSKVAVVLLAFAMTTLAGVAGVSVTTSAETPATSDMGFEVAPEPSAQAQAEPCRANIICLYRSKNYVNMHYMAFCSANGMVKFDRNLRSARNRCGNKSSKLFNGGTLVACMNPGGNRPNPGVYDRLFVPVNYGPQC